MAEAAGERMFAELRRLMVADGVLEGLALADRLGLLDAVLPELAALHGVEQSHSTTSTSTTTLEVLRRLIELERRGAEPALRAVLDEPLADELTRGQALRFGALCTTSASPATRGQRPDGRVTFMGHDRLGQGMVHGSVAGCARASAWRLRGQRHAPPPGARLPRARAPARAPPDLRYLQRTEPVEVEVTLLSCADRLATGGRKAEEGDRRPPRAGRS